MSAPGAWPPLPSRARALLPPLIVALAVIVVVWPGLMPDVGFWDTAEFQTVAPLLGTAHPTGYPTYVILGFLANFLLAPVGEPAFRMNVFSLLCVAVAAAAAARLVIRLTGSAPIGMAAGIGLATTPVAWNLATHADPHTLHLALVAILCLVLVRWEAARRAAEAAADRWLVAAAALFGLSAGNHSLTLLLAPSIGLFVLAVEPAIVRRPRFVAACAAALVGTLVLVYLELPLRAGVFRAPLVYAKPETWDGFWYIALAEQFRGALHDPLGELPRKLAELAGLASAQLGFLAPAAAVGFVATAIRFPRYALLTGSALVVTALFNAAYSNADIERYYLGPALWAWTWLGLLAGVAGDALGRILGRVQDRLADADRQRPAVASRGIAVTGRAMVAIGLAAALVAPAVASFERRAAEADRSRDTAARDWVTAALSRIEDGAVVVSWWSTSTTLWYAQYVDGLRTDLTIVDDRTRLDLDYGEATDVIARFLGSRPVYVIRANPHDLGLVAERYVLEPLGASPATDVWRVVGPRDAG
ncbi:MAG TPA: DUF2723 domain-containing protein [Candidatus Sulfomarinibacteraceae bacterium]|nr:DUF2723 domain-containing protein [Candidatus Sulfomarinibacteraceae bacterium]